MKPTDAATYERARRLANLAVWTVDLQCRRLNSTEPEDEKFPLRQWSDLHFLIVALTRVRRAAVLASKVPAIRQKMVEGLKGFDTALPHLKTMRDVAEHVDEYATDDGRKKAISRKDLEVSLCDGETWTWLGFELNPTGALEASAGLFEVIRECGTLLPKATQPEPKSRHGTKGPLVANGPD